MDTVMQSVSTGLWSMFWLGMLFGIIDGIILGVLLSNKYHIILKFI